MAFEKGKLVRWIDARGFGFIQSDNGKNEIFIHLSALKDMSRKPTVGDTILYQVNVDGIGKLRAVSAQIEGVSVALSIFPKEAKPKHPSPSLVNIKPHKKLATKARSPQKSLYLFPVLIAGAIGLTFMYYKISKEKSFNDTVQLPVTETHPVSPSAPAITIEKFKCQGKVWCSEMTSYEEALFYLQNCLGTKMDGDHDGNLCEQQFHR